MMSIVESLKPEIDFYKVGTNLNNLIYAHNDAEIKKLFYTYGCNFFETADRTNLYVCQEGTKNKDIAKLDSWFYPLIYMYRQSLELMLKACLFEDVTNDEDRQRIIGLVRHDLKMVLDEILNLKNLSIFNSENGRWLAEYLANIKSIDKSSDMFRYPFGNDDHTIFQSKSSIDLVTLHYNMERAFEVVNNIYKHDIIINKSFKQSFPPKLLIEGENNYTKSVVGYKFPANSFLLTCVSYYEVAQYLKSQIILRHRSEYFVPMCYMYRNAIELGLKRIIVEVCSFEQEKSYRILRRKKHSILGLWNSIPQDIKHCALSEFDSFSLPMIEGYIRYFHNLDTTSDMFRYPCNKSLEIYFSEGKVLNVENVAECFERLYTVLDCMNFAQNKGGDLII